MKTVHGREGDNYLPVMEVFELSLVTVVTPNQACNLYVYCWIPVSDDER